MAMIRLSEKQIACISNKNIIVLQLGSPEYQVYHSKTPELAEVDNPCQPKGNEDGSERVLACGFSTGGQYFVSCDDYKQLTLWDVKHDSPWQPISTRSLARRVTSLTFASDDSVVLVADKSGDVFLFSITSPEEEGQLLMGHVSMLLDLVLVSADRLLVTCDRDEKIRISHFPNAHSIHSYCLGHTDFVSRLVYAKEEDIIISGSGDGSLRIWEYISGHQLYTTDCHEHVDKYIMPTESTLEAGDGSRQDHQNNTDSQDDKTKQISNEGLDLKCVICCEKQKIIAVGFERVPVVLLYNYSSTDKAHATLTFLQEVTLQGHLWDVSFDTEGQLWVLQAVELNPLAVYRRDTSTNKFVPVDDSLDGDILNIKTTAAKQWPLLKASLDSESLFAVLHKVKIDNAKFYQERKQQKLDEQKLRYKQKAERRKRDKAVLPSGESNNDCLVDISHKVAPPGEAVANSPVFKKNKVDEL